MRTAFVVFALFACSVANADAKEFGPPDDAKMNKIIAISLSVDPGKLEAKRGSWRCEIFGAPVQGWGNTLDEAHSIAGMKCIQKKCSTVGDQMSHFLFEDGESEQIFRGLGMDASALGELRGKFARDQLRDSLNQSACKRNDNTGALSRMMAYDSCFGVPADCAQVTSEATPGRSSSDRGSKGFLDSIGGASSSGAASSGAAR